MFTWDIITIFNIYIYVYWVKKLAGNSAGFLLTLTTQKYFFINHGDQRVLLFEIIISVLFSSFRFILIHMLWVYDHYNCFNSFRARTVFRRQILTSTDVRIWRLKTVLALRLHNIIILYSQDISVLNQEISDVLRILSSSTVTTKLIISVIYHQIDNFVNSKH